MNTHQHISDELLINYLLGECAASEKVVVENWLAASEENKTRYEQFAKVWGHSKELATDIDVNEDEAWERLQARMQGQDSVHLKVKRTPKFSKRRIALIAGAVALLLQAVWFFNRDVKPVDNIPAIVKVDTPIIQTIESSLATKITSLADESVITLNKKSSLETPEKFITDERRVALKGEAFFSITPDKTKPFIIETQADVEIRVVGTSFNVKSFEDYTEVIVETGVVELTKGNSIMRLRKNDKARIYSKDSIIKVVKKADDLYKYYRSKTFDCDNTPLWKVVDVLNEAYDEKIIIKDKSLRNLKLDTQFDQESIEIVMEVLSETFEFNVTKRKNTYYITQ